MNSLQDLEWFKFLCQSSGSPENYPDIFHLWTAERNGLDVFLTMERKLPELIKRVKEKRGAPKINIEVLRPLDLLDKLDIHTPDPVPIEPDIFYYYKDVPAEWW